MRKTVITATLAFVLGGGAVFSISTIMPNQIPTPPCTQCITEHLARLLKLGCRAIFMMR